MFVGAEGICTGGACHCGSSCCLGRWFLERPSPLSGCSSRCRNSWALSFFCLGCLCGWCWVVDSLCCLCSYLVAVSSNCRVDRHSQTTCRGGRFWWQSTLCQFRRQLASWYQAGEELFLGEFWLGTPGSLWVGHVALPMLVVISLD